MVERAGIWVILGRYTAPNHGGLHRAPQIMIQDAYKSARDRNIKPKHRLKTIKRKQNLSQMRNVLNFVWKFG